ncbi:3-oxoacyl-[acyl-carrier protein] reductase [Geosmithia morbida]|uniref:3-oxoacyl-[acyl-carrier protein] reductase n=1 Tax=Geosmithia morbida TaxID=1094350 RepID=A0A9P4Z2L9_9HYPO|nr:3-oxoacyl-[acyl-carrier protein] reductase [Geosmithia morbida]KAF4126341.1 3-oxoacyl-[acyl-carrier protein] reductase [Geosmithia morbida]
MIIAGKHCAIVGATGTIGTAIARAFASKGAVLSLLGRTALDMQSKMEPTLSTTVLKRTPDAELSDILGTNLTATMLVCKYAKVQDWGCIVNVSSLMANRPAAGAAAYAAAKAGVIPGLTSALCLEMATRSIRVNALLPGWVESPMWDNLRPTLKEKYLQNTPARRAGTPDEVADAAVFLASNDFANNCVLNLDGGLSAA